MAFSTQDIKTPIPTRQDFANAFGNNQRLIRFFEQLTNDVRQTIPDAIVSVQDIGTAPFIVQAASSLTPNAFVLQAGTGLTKTTAPGTVTLALNTPVPIALGGTGATTAAVALSNLGGVTAAQAAAAAPVQSVFGRIDTVTAQSGDYSVAQVTGAAPLASPTFTGVPAVPTAAAHTNTTQAASTAFVEGEFASPPGIGTGTPGAANFTSVTATSYAGPGAGYSITTSTGIGSGGAIQLFDGTHGNAFTVLNGGTLTATFGATGLTMASAYSIVPSQTAGIVGTTTNNNANAGAVGEEIKSTGTGVSVTSGTPLNVTSIPLTAGDWEVFGSCAFTPSAGCTPSALIAGANNVSVTLAAAPNNTVQQLAFPAALAQAFPFPKQRFSLSGATTIYLVAEAVFSGGTMTATGTIRARRPR